MDRCIGVFGRIFGHKFVGRYDDENESKFEISQDNIKRAIELRCMIMVEPQHNQEKSIHVHDVCARCGKVIKRETKC